MSVRVLETNILHASDVLYWLDGSTGSGGGDADRIRLERTVEVEILEGPRDLRLIHRPGRTAFLRRPVGPMIEGLADQAQRQRGNPTTYRLRGVVREGDGYFNPRAFDLTLGAGNGQAVTLFPSPLGARLGKGGGLLGNLRFSAEVPAAWAIIEVQVTTAPGTTLTFQAQADGRGDFVLAMSRLPPLPDNVDDYAGQLGIRASAGADAGTPLDPATLPSVRIESLAAQGQFQPSIGFNVKPGEVLQMKSFDRDYLAVQPV